MPTVDPDVMVVLEELLVPVIEFCRRILIDNNVPDPERILTLFRAAIIQRCATVPDPPAPTDES